MIATTSASTNTNAERTLSSGPGDSDITPLSLVSGS
jgi:hypothetical protein